jgi:endoglucanase
MVCSHITDDGFLKVGNVGGLDRRLLLGQSVFIHSRKTGKKVNGIICTQPPHLNSNKGKKVPEMTEIFIDTGMTKQQVSQFVSLGDVVTFATTYKPLAGTRITAPSLDNSAGVVAILGALELLQTETLQCDIIVVFSFAEEVGCRGAQTAAFGVSADYTIAVDVSFALTSGDNEEKCGIMGEGVMLGISPVLDRDFTEELRNIANTKGILYQLEIMGEATSTNADKLAVTKSGIKTGLLSIPLKYMHTPVEVVDIDDIIETSRLICEAVKGGDFCGETQQAD